VRRPGGLTAATLVRYAPPAAVAPIGLESPLRRSLVAFATIASTLMLPAVAFAAEEESKAHEENVTEFMLILIGVLIALGVVIAAIEAKRQK
jgi:hypothetical protein